MTSFGLTGCCTRNLDDSADPSPESSTFDTKECEGSEWNSDQYDPTSHGKRHEHFIGEIVSCPLLLEKTPIEWLPGGGAALDGRIRDFTHFLAGRSEGVICVTGHSQYFKKMLGMDEKFDNCDVWRVEFEVVDGGGGGEGLDNGHAGVFKVVDRLFNFGEILKEE